MLLQTTMFVLLSILLSMVSGEIRSSPFRHFGIRGGETRDEPPPADLIKQLSNEHVQQCAESPYWQCSEGDKALEGNQADDVSFKSYEMKNWALPDFDDSFDHDKMIYVSEGPIFSREECRKVVQSAEKFFAENSPDGKWTHLPSGRFQIDGFWIKDVPPVKAWFDEQLKLKLFPTLVKLFPEFVDSVSKLCVDSAYVFKYTPETGKKSDIHTDSGCLSFTISLNPKEEYNGGGTWFETLGEDGTVIEMDVGQATFRPGGVRHQGNAITSGQRYIIGGFMMHKDKVELVRRMLNKGTQQAAESNLYKAVKFLRYAVGLNKGFDGSRVTFADALKRSGDVDSAGSELEAALKINPRNVEGLFSLGLIRKDERDLKAAAALFERVLSVDAEDLDAMYACGQTAGLRDDPETELKWYSKFLESDPFLQHKLAARVSCNCGVAFGILGRMEEEQSMLRQSLDIDPDLFFAAYSLGSSLATGGDFAGAVDMFRHVLTLDLPEKLPDGHAKALKQLYMASAMVLRQEGQCSQSEAQEKLKHIMGEKNLTAFIHMQRSAM